MEDKRMNRSALFGYGLLPCLLISILYCSHTTPPVEQQLSVTISGSDTIVRVFDSLLVRFAAGTASPGSVRFLWFFDSPLTLDTTFDNHIVKRFSLRDTGSHVIVIKAVGDRGNESAPETLFVEVTYPRPTMIAQGDSIAYVNTPYVFHCSSTSSGARVARYEWYIDTPGHQTVSIDTAPSLSWAIGDTGQHFIVAKAIDEQGIASLPSILSIRVTYLRPQLRLSAPAFVKVNSALMVRFSASDPFSSTLKYRYYIDSANKSVTTFDSTVTLAWPSANPETHLLVGKAINAVGVESLPETLSVRVTASRPAVTLSVPAAVPVNDTIAITANAVDLDGAVKQYRWSIDGGFWFTTDTSSILWAFNNSPTVAGSHTVSVVAIDNDSLFSDTATNRIAVTLNRPAVRFLDSRDTTIYAGTTLTIRAAASDSNGVIAAYRWMVDGRPAGQFARSDSARFTWGTADAGVHHLMLTVVDDDSLESPPDTLRVKVLAGTPAITAMHDTTVLSSDTVRVTCSASDPNGTIVRYLWNFSGSGWGDSTTVPNNTLVYAGKSIVSVIVGAKDNDGLIAADTVTVTFNRPPDSITMQTPGLNDTFRFTQTAARCTVSFAYHAPDPDNDPVTYSLFWGPSSIDSVALNYQGLNRSASVGVTRPGLYFWRLVARDSRGQTSTKTGKVVVLREYRICFVGHSVVVGMGGDGFAGGFRGGVLDSLRKNLGTYERLKVVGPFVTNAMGSSIIDDSCMAVSGTTAREIYLMLGLDQIRLWADIWVLMIGVNDNYSYNEYGYTAKIMDIMNSRNPQSRLYVVNGYALSDAFTLANFYRPYFNQALADSVATRNTKGAHISIVDVFAAFGTATGQYDSTWYADGLHPNQLGYNRLRDRIYTSMKGSNPPALPANP